VLPSTGPDVFDAFLSYHSGDAAWALALKTALESKGLRIWIDRDQLRPGDRFVGALEDALSTVRCVVVIISPGSLQSSWVREEYDRAVALTNARGAEHRLIGVLIDDAEPQGFLANRSWVDFRDRARFDESLDALVSGITGQRAGSPSGGAAADFHRSDPPVPDAASGVDEVDCLGRVIARTRDTSRRLWLLRSLGPIPGLAVAGVFAWIAQDSPVLVRAGVVVAGSLVTGLGVWSRTVTTIDQCHEQLEQFELLRDGLEACRRRTIPGCSRLRERFWDMMDRRTRDLAAPPGAHP
jgi:hypothetical protein